MPSRPSARRSALCLVALALGALALPSLSSAAPAPAQDSVVGSISAGMVIAFSIGADVSSGASGENPSGSFTYFAGSATSGHWRSMIARASARLREVGALRPRLRRPKAYINWLRANYDWVIVDTPPGFTASMRRWPR